MLEPGAGSYRAVTISTPGKGVGSVSRTQNESSEQRKRQAGWPHRKETENHVLSPHFLPTALPPPPVELSSEQNHPEARGELGVRSVMVRGHTFSPQTRPSPTT